MSHSSGGTNNLDGLFLTEQTQVPFALQVSRNIVYNTANVEIFGRNNNISTVEQTLWEHGGNPFYPTIAAQVTITSSSTDDTEGGDGVRTVTIYGLDNDYNSIQEEITLSGIAIVSSSLDFLRVNSVQSETAGTNGQNGGDIVGLISGQAVFQINAGEGMAHSGFFTLPSGHTAFLNTAEFSVGKDKTVDASVYIKQFEKPRYKVSHAELFESVVTVNYNYSIIIPEKSDVWMAGIAIVGTGNTVSGRINMIVIRDDDNLYPHPFGVNSF